MTLDSFLQQFAAQIPHGLFWALGIAFVAGVLASAVCPCTLPMGLGMASVVGSYETSQKKSGFPIALSFFLGIVINLTVLGAVAGRLGEILTEAFGQYWALGMAALSLIAAIVAFFGPQLKVSQLEVLRRPGLAGAFLYGFIFSLGTSAAPLLLLLTVAAAQGKTESGLALAIFFGLGRGFPFLLIGIFAGLVTKLTALSVWRRTIQAASALSLLIVGAYYLRVYFAFL
jgi:cytochrome c-type biogenesis protein